MRLISFVLRRLSDPSKKCDVKGCGLLASGLSHLAALKTWLDNADSKSKGILIFEDDATLGYWWSHPDTIKALQEPPKGWRLLKLQDCLG